MAILERAINWGKLSPRGQKWLQSLQMSHHWNHRQTRYGETYYKVAQSQNWRCPVCQDTLFNGEALHTHHRKQVDAGSLDTEENLVHLHQACHQYLHKNEVISSS